MGLDPYTLITISPLLTVVMGVNLLITARIDYPGNIQKSMRHWGIVYLIQTGGWWLLVRFDGFSPDFLSIILGNTLGVWSLAEVYHALRVFDGKSSRWWFSYSMTGLCFLAGLAWLALPDLFNRYIWVKSFLAAALLLMCGMRLMKAPMDKPSINRLILGSIFLLQSLFPIQRCISILWSDQPLTLFLNDTYWQTQVFGGSAIGGLLTSIWFLLVCNERLNQELMRLAMTDQLTGLYNRRKIEQSTDLVIQRAEKSQQPQAFLLFDVDNFKTINDTYGHLAGDKALQVIAERLRTNLRSSDLVGRLGGDEFFVILPNTPKVDGQKIAERLVSEVSKVKVVFDGDEIQLGISFGMAIVTSGKADFPQIVRVADQNLYAMKQNRRNPDFDMIAS